MQQKRMFSDDALYLCTTMLEFQKLQIYNNHFNQEGKVSEVLFSVSTAILAIH